MQFSVLTQQIVLQVVASTAMPQWQRKELQTILKALQRTANTAIKKLEVQQVLWQQCTHRLLTALWHTPVNLVSATLHSHSAAKVPSEIRRKQAQSHMVHRKHCVGLILLASRASFKMQ